MQSRGEEVANAVSHGAGLLATLAFLPVLIVVAARRNDTWGVVGAAVFGTSMALLYSTSLFYHAMPQGSNAKRVWRVLDHSAIYILIAGTYTPFALGALRGPVGFTLFGVMWGCAALGVVLKSVGGFGYPKLSTVMYVVMGWAALFVLKPMWERVGPQGLAWVLAGGLAYTGGVLFYARDKYPYRHFLWHLCVVAGSACHAWAVLWYAAGLPR